jgi:hypothetical protein
MVRIAGSLSEDYGTGQMKFAYFYGFADIQGAHLITGVNASQSRW